MKTSCVYKIQSISSPERVYVGSTNDYDRRIKCHISKLKNNTHHSAILQNHVNKHGIEDLNFSIIELCLSIGLLLREQYYIDKLNPHFNICKIAGSPEGHKHNNKSIQKISEAAKERIPWNKGKKVSEEIRLKLVNNLNMRKITLRGRKISEHERQRRIERQGVPIIQFDLNQEFIQYWRSIKVASETLAITRSSITACLSGKHKSAGGYKWEYKYITI